DGLTSGRHRLRIALAVRRAMRRRVSADAMALALGSAVLLLALWKRSLRLGGIRLFGRRGRMVLAGVVCLSGVVRLVLVGLAVLVRRLFLEQLAQELLVVGVGLAELRGVEREQRQSAAAVHHRQPAVPALEGAVLEHGGGGGGAQDQVGLGLGL